MDAAADESLQTFFKTHENDVRTWFNVIAPASEDVGTLRRDLHKLAAKDW